MSFLSRQATLRLLFVSTGIALFVGGLHQASAEESSTGAVVNVSQSQSTIVVVPTPKPEEPADAVVFYVTDDRQVAKPGDLLTYRVVVRNQRNDDINEVKITAHIPDYLVPQATSPEAEANPTARTLTWNDLNLSARAEQTYAFRAQVAAETPLTTNLRVVAEINGPGVRGSYTDSTVIESPGFVVSGQAATTTAPVASVTQTKPTPRPVAPTARTGTALPGTLLISTLLGSLGLITNFRSSS